MRRFALPVLTAFALALGLASAHTQTASRDAERWSATKANEWYAAQPWPSGANYISSNAINQLAMFQADTFDPSLIDRELGWAHDRLGMNTVRVYLHDLLWEQDAAGFTARLDRFLAIAERHGIRPILVLFDSCWDPDPALGPQRRPTPGVHNSGWVQSPSRRDLVNPAREAHFQAYVEGIVGAFATDRRVLAWDVWNEPDNPGGGSYNGEQLPGEAARIETLLPKAFAWARGQRPVQPLTSALWLGPDWRPGSTSLTPVQRAQLDLSDVVSFHNYEKPASFEKRIAELRPYGRPILCTEWMARSEGSTPEAILPIGRREGIGMLNWGLVDGATQTRFPWDSWQHPYEREEPPVWFHDLLRADGTPYKQAEAALFRRMRDEPGG